MIDEQIRISAIIVTVKMMMIRIDLKRRDITVVPLIKQSYREDYGDSGMAGWGRVRGWRCRNGDSAAATSTAASVSDP